MNCPKCGAVVPAQAHFCPNCGTGLTDEPPNQARIAVRQQVGHVGGGKVAGLEVHYADQLIIEHLSVDADVDARATPGGLNGLQRSLRWILVAGLGKVNLLPGHAEVYHASRAVGASLAEHGFGLVVGGWSGVDHVVAESFAAALLGFDKPLSDNLVQIVPKGKMPQFRGGRVVHAGQQWLDSVHRVRKADAVILIGGAGGTYVVYEYALKERKPVFPLAGTGGDARKVFQDMLTAWNRQAMGVVPLDGFTRVLGQEIASAENARQVADELMMLVKLRLES